MIDIHHDALVVVTAVVTKVLETIFGMRCKAARHLVRKQHHLSLVRFFSLG